jgi:hypothetical protein
VGNFSPEKVGNFSPELTLRRRAYELTAAPSFNTFDHTEIEERWNLAGDDRSINEIRRR